MKSVYYMANVQLVTPIIIVVIVLDALGSYLILASDRIVNLINGLRQELGYIFYQTPSHLYLVTHFYIETVLLLKEAS